MFVQLCELLGLLLTVVAPINLGSCLTVLSPVIFTPHAHARIFIASLLLCQPLPGCASSVYFDLLLHN